MIVIIDATLEKVGKPRRKKGGYTVDGIMDLATTESETASRVERVGIAARGASGSSSETNNVDAWTRPPMKTAPIPRMRFLAFASAVY